MVEIAARWRDVGLSLRLKKSTLDNIGAGHPGNPGAALNDVLSEWLNKNYNVGKFGDPTWRKLVATIMSPSGGNNRALAERIAAAHPGWCIAYDG